MVDGLEGCNEAHYLEEKSWYKLQGDVRYIIQFLSKTDLEEMSINSFQEMCTMKMVVHYAVMGQPAVDMYIDGRRVRCKLDT
jgi:hypothetical protein